MVVLLSLSASTFGDPLDMSSSPLQDAAGDDGGNFVHGQMITHRLLKGSWQLQQQKQLEEERASRPRMSSEVHVVGSQENNDQISILAKNSNNPSKELPTESIISMQQQQQQQQHNSPMIISEDAASADSFCDGKRIFMYDLPARFHESILQQCDNKIAKWLNFCPHMENEGFGRPLGSDKNWQDWFATDPYMLEVIFHARMQHYRCRTLDSGRADAFFIPYYSGLDALHFLYGKNMSDRGSQGLDLVAWLEENGGEESSWKKNGGHDHFMVMGRTAWDFCRPLDSSEGWGTGLRSLNQLQNVTALFLEKRPWQWNDQAIPYPTAFHPTSFSQLRNWQIKVQTFPRSFLFAFIGAPRSGQQGSIRQLVLDQCASSSSSCTLVDCHKIKCAHNPLPITERLLESDFCLQPPGDTATRRSTFDGMLAGCIPVFFHNDSAYTQYSWHLPKDPEKYSVWIPEKDFNRVEEILSSYSREQILNMRAVIIDLIPGILYASSAAVSDFADNSVKDAFDLSIDAMLERVSARKPLQKQR